MTRRQRRGARRYGRGDVDEAAKILAAHEEGRDVVLSGREWAVLETLLARPGSTLSRQQIEDKLYGWGDEVSSNAIEVYIHGLRKKLGAGLILNVRGVGYMYASPDS